jgi:protein-disulfide isomerase
MNKRLWIVFGIIIVAVIWFAIYATTNNSSDTVEISTDDVDASQVISVERGTIIDGFSDEDIEKVTDNVYGNADADVTLIQWMNFQCSACQSLFHSLDDIYNEYSDRVAFVDRYLYLSGHTNGLATSVAAEAAAKQNKFYEMHYKLFSNAEEWNNATIDTREAIFLSYAEAIDGLDTDQWLEDYRNYEKNGIKKRLDFQNKLALDYGVTGSPYIMVNGKKVSNNKDSIIQAIEEALGNS